MAQPVDAGVAAGSAVGSVAALESAEGSAVGAVAVLVWAAGSGLGFVAAREYAGPLPKACS